PGWLREAQQPILTRLLADPQGWQEAVSVATSFQRDRGLPAPVRSPSMLPIFWVDDEGARHRIFGDGGEFTIGSPGGEVITGDRLRKAPVEEPHRISPDALLRPIVQDGIFETSAVLLGPTELGYHLQIRLAYGFLGVRRPLLLPRPRMRPAASEDIDALTTLGLAGMGPSADLALLTPSPEGERLAGGLEDLLDGFIERIESLATDPLASDALRRRSLRLTRRWRQDAVKLKDAILRGYDKGPTDLRHRLEQLVGRVFAAGQEPERNTNILALWARLGPALWEVLSPAADHFDGRIRWVDLPEPIVAEMRKLDEQH
ncbi:MAG TPA: bacillithiol biosynthesis BshC, partial [Planctomycetes bacterium]|nr:bacillithiol biosynthesis BshC [Planctomycetota bacterium]